MDSNSPSLCQFVQSTILLIVSFSQVLNRTLDTKVYETPAPILPPIHPVPLLPQHIITSGTRKDCIRLRGLPYEAQVEHILDFLGDYAKNIVFQGVHMVYNAQVKATCISLFPDFV